MKSCLWEYADCDVNEIAEKYIEEKPQIGEIPVAPDERENAPMIQGTGVEDTTMTEGTVTFDIRFTAAVPSVHQEPGGSGEEKIGLILNVEAQNQFYPGYPLIKRGIYYCCRMVSSQYGTVFTDSHYEKIKKVYSIWICTDPPGYRENTINRYVMSEDSLVGQIQEPQQNYDLLAALMICLGDTKKENCQGILRLLSVLLSSEIKAAEKKEILEKEYHIEMKRKFGEEVSQMCNLSEGLEQRAAQRVLQGLQQGIAQGSQQANLNSIKNLMDTMNWTVKEAMDALKIKEEERSLYVELLKDKKSD